MKTAVKHCVSSAYQIGTGGGVEGRRGLAPPPIRFFPYHQTRAVIGFALFRVVSLRVSLSLSFFFLSHNSKAPRKVPKKRLPPDWLFFPCFIPALITVPQRTFHWLLPLHTTFGQWKQEHGLIR